MLPVLAATARSPGSPRVSRGNRVKPWLAVSIPALGPVPRAGQIPRYDSGRLRQVQKLLCPPPTGRALCPFPIRRGRSWLAVRSSLLGFLALCLGQSHLGSFGGGGGGGKSPRPETSGHGRQRVAQPDPRSWMWGTSVRTSMGPFVWHWEAWRRDHLAFCTNPPAVFGKSRLLPAREPLSASLPSGNALQGNRLRPHSSGKASALRPSLGSRQEPTWFWKHRTHRSLGQVVLVRPGPQIAPSFPPPSIQACVTRSPGGTHTHGGPGGPALPGSRSRGSIVPPKGECAGGRGLLRGAPGSGGHSLANSR